MAGGGPRAGVIVADASGNARMPGGFCARVGSLPTSPLSYPVKATVDGREGDPFFFIDSGPMPLPIERKDGNPGFPIVTLNGLAPGQNVAYVVAQSEMDALFLGAGGFLSGALLDASGRAVGTSVLAGSGGALTPRDEWSELVRLGKCYGASANMVASVGNSNLAQIFNPAASGKVLLIKQAQFYVGAASDVTFGTDNTNAATDLGAVGNNLLPTGAAGIAHLRTTVTPTAGATTNSMQRVGGQLTELRLEVPGGFLAEIPAGWGINLVVANTNTAMVANFLYAEVDAATYPR